VWKEKWSCRQPNFVGLQVCEDVEVQFVPGNHATMLDKKETAAVINRQMLTCEGVLKH
jgi:hypothetical protein